MFTFEHPPKQANRCITRIAIGQQSETSQRRRGQPMTRMIASNGFEIVRTVRAIIDQLVQCLLAFRGEET
jgi:hypothetical protein